MAKLLGIKLPENILGMDTGLIFLGTLALIILYTGWPFSGTGMSQGEIWHLFWQGVFYSIMITTGISYIKKRFKKWM